MVQRLNGHWHAAAMCKANLVSWGHGRSNDSTTAYSDELSRSIGIPMGLLIRKIMTGLYEQHGSWVSAYRPAPDSALGGTALFRFLP